jgi:hypothetical protein
MHGFISTASVGDLHAAACLRRCEGVKRSLHNKSTLNPWKYNTENGQVVCE